MARRTDNHVVVITGASSGIGKATALAFAREGARLALCARREPELEATASACRRLGAEVIWTRTDVGDEAQVQDLARKAVEAFGRHCQRKLPGSAFIALPRFCLGTGSRFLGSKPR